jgi:hypothetical protein
MIPSLDEKQHMIDLVKEIREIVLNLPNLKSHEDKLKVAERMEAIKSEMKEFRRRYPNA